MLFQSITNCLKGAALIALLTGCNGNNFTSSGNSDRPPNNNSTNANNGGNGGLNDPNGNGNGAYGDPASPGGTNGLNDPNNPNNNPGGGTGGSGIGGGGNTGGGNGTGIGGGGGSIDLRVEKGYGVGGQQNIYWLFSTIDEANKCAANVALPSRANTNAQNCSSSVRKCEVQATTNQVVLPKTQTLLSPNCICHVTRPSFALPVSCIRSI